MANRARDKFSAMLLAKCRWRLGCFECESGNSAVEYGLLISLIARAMIVSATALGSTIGTQVLQGLADYFFARA